MPIWVFNDPPKAVDYGTFFSFSIFKNWPS